jgi:hypothetical protein
MRKTRNWSFRPRRSRARAWNRSEGRGLPCPALPLFFALPYVALPLLVGRDGMGFGIRVFNSDTATAKSGLEMSTGWQWHFVLTSVFIGKLVSRAAD